MEPIANWWGRWKRRRADVCNPAFNRVPPDAGLPALDVDDILVAHQDVIDRIRIGFGIGRAEFEQQPYAAIHRYARLVHLLPATRDRAFHHPGGLLRMGLEVARFALQGTDGHIFCGRATISVRRRLEPRWRYATFLAGLCSGIDLVVSQLTVADGHDSAWQPAVLPLADWLQQRGTTHYVVTWHAGAHNPCCPGMLALTHVIAPGDLRDLAADSTAIVPQLLVSLAGTQPADDRNVLDALVRRAHALVIDRNSSTYAEESTGGCAPPDVDAGSPKQATPAPSDDPEPETIEASPVQLVLPIDAAPDAEPDAATPTPSSPSAEIAAQMPDAPGSQPLNHPSRVQIEAPLHLQATVRDALHAIVGTLDKEASGTACRLTPSGLFISFAAFACRGINAPFALRALAGADMLARADAIDLATLLPGQVSEPVPGLLLASRLVTALPSGAGQTLHPVGPGHAVTPL